MIRLEVLLVLVALQLAHSFNIQPRILNGLQSNPSDFPFYVYFDVQFEYKTVFCGGTLISDRWVLTAAHCLRYEVPINVYIGIDSNGNFHDKMVVQLDSQHIHFTYKYPEKPSDMGLFELPRPIVANDFVRPVKLPTDCGNDLENIAVVAAGKGQPSIRQEFIRNSTLLMHAYLDTTSTRACMQALDNPTHPDSIICVKPANGQSVSGGDSGGPLLRRDDNTLIGVASYLKLNHDDWLNHSELNVELQVFTRIHFYFDWLTRITGIEFPKCERNYAYRLY